MQAIPLNQMIIVKGIKPINDDRIFYVLSLSLWLVVIIYLRLGGPGLHLLILFGI